MANGFPEGNFRIVNKETGACISSENLKKTNEVNVDAETSSLSFSYTNDRLLAVHDKVKDARYILGAFTTKETAGKLLDKHLERFLSLLPKQDEQTLAHLRTIDCLDIVYFLEIFIRINGEETIKSELVGKLDDNKLNEYLNKAIACKSILSIEQKFKDYVQFSFGVVPKFNASLDPALLEANMQYINAQYEHATAQYNEQEYKIILTSLQLDALNRQIDNSDEYEFRLRLDSNDVYKILKKLQKETFGELFDKIETEYKNVKDPQKEAVKIILELIKALDLDIKQKNSETAKKILQTALKSNESFEQLKTALNNLINEIDEVETYSGDVFLQASDKQHLTKWAFKDGYIFVEGQPDAVLTCWGSYPSIRHRIGDSSQHWEFK